MVTEYKTKKEFDDEDWDRYRKKQQDILERKQAKWEADVFKCKTEGCGKSIKDLMIIWSNIKNIWKMQWFVISQVTASFPGEVDVSGCKEDPTRKLVKGKVEKLRPSVLAPGFFKGRVETWVGEYTSYGQFWHERER